MTQFASLREAVDSKLSEVRGAPEPSAAVVELFEDAAAVLSRPGALHALRVSDDFHIPSLEFDPDGLERAAVVAALSERIGQQFSNRFIQSWFFGTNLTPGLNGDAPLQLIRNSSSVEYLEVLEGALARVLDPVNRQVWSRSPQELSNVDS